MFLHNSAATVGRQEDLVKEKHTSLAVAQRESIQLKVQNKKLQRSLTRSIRQSDVVNAELSGCQDAE